MDVSSINADLIRGNVTTIILGCLWSNDKYGYEILKEIEDKSNGQYVIKQATLYNQLKRLEQQGLITSYDGDPDDTGGGKRKYFALTLDGRNYLKKEKNEYEYSRTILDKLVSSQEYDFTNPTPFNASELRPYSLHVKEEKPEVVYKDKIVEVEKIVEKKIYLDDNNNEITEEEYIKLKEDRSNESIKNHKTIEELFKQLDEKSAEIDKINAEREDERIKNEQLLANQQNEFIQKQKEEELKRKEEFEAEKIRIAQAAKSIYPTATVVRNENGFEYEKDNKEYKEFYIDLRTIEKEDESEDKPANISSSESDIKAKLYLNGYKIRPYDKGNTSEYYTFKFINSNRINKDSFLIVLSIFLVELAIMWLSTYSTISYAYYLPILLIGSILCLVPLFIYLANPIKRVRANFNFKLSLLNRTMFWIEISVICILIGFFGLGATNDDFKVILCSIVLPAILLTNIPISSIIYWLLYRTRNYHVA